MDARHANTKSPAEMECPCCLVKLVVTQKKGSQQSSTSRRDHTFLLTTLLESPSASSSSSDSSDKHESFLRPMGRDQAKDRPRRTALLNNFPEKTLSSGSVSSQASDGGDVNVLAISSEATDVASSLSSFRCGRAYAAAQYLSLIHI